MLYNLWLTVKWHLDPTVTLGSVVAFRQALRYWWQERPRRVRCEFCGQPAWVNGLPEAAMYCNEDCAFYGPQVIPRDPNEVQF